jgi:hypothetical protein
MFPISVILRFELIITPINVGMLKHKNKPDVKRKNLSFFITL